MCGAGLRPLSPRDLATMHGPERVEAGAVCASGGRRVLPRASSCAPALAWTESDTARARGADDGRRLLRAAPDRPDADGRRAALAMRDPHAKADLRTRRDRLLEALRPPYFVLTAVALIVSVHWAGGERARAMLEWAPGSWRREPWRLVSYSAVHASAAHLALNALVALLVGWRLEREQSAWRVAGVWAGGVVAGALGAGALQPHVRVVGASAAVYALLTAHLPNVWLRFGHVPLWWFRPLSVLVLCATEGCWAAARALAPESSRRCAASAPSGDEERVAWAAHVLGAAAGVPVAFLLFTGERGSTFSTSAWRAASATLVAGGLAAATLHFALWSRAAPA